MAGLDRNTPIPTNIVVHQRSRALEIVFDDGLQARLSFEFLRVQSPSAEVRGHGPGQETLQVGKRDVQITALDPVGNYAVQPRFSDGHDTGIYSWDYLHHLARQHDALWQDYLKRLDAAGASRDPAGSAAGVGNAPGTGNAAGAASAAASTGEMNAVSIKRGA